MPTRLLVIGGPTACGKSALALGLAELLDGTVINADSMQIYRDLRVVTARPDAEAEARAPHRLYGALDGAELCSAARWAELAAAEIAAAEGERRLPIVVGGTGLYLKTLLHGIAAVPPVPEESRAAARALHAEVGAAAFHAALAGLDPGGAARLHPNDSQRVIRAYEVVTGTGRPLGDWQAASAELPSRYDARIVTLLPPRDSLYAACEARLDAMMAAGALDEIEALLRRNLAADLPVMKAVGVPELARLARGERDHEQALVEARQATRNYAKRQYTWFRHRLAPDWPVDAQFSNSLIAEIGQKIRNWG